MGDGRLGGQMGNGMQPNVHSLYRGNTFTEGNHIVNYACGEAGYVEVRALYSKQLMLYHYIPFGSFGVENRL